MKTFAPAAHAPEDVAICVLDATVAQNFPSLAKIMAPHALNLTYQAPERPTQDHAIFVAYNDQPHAILAKISIDYFAQPAAYTAIGLHPQYNWDAATSDSIDDAAREVIRELTASGLIPLAF